MHIGRIAMLGVGGKDFQNPKKDQHLILSALSTSIVHAKPNMTLQPNIHSDTM
jgi:hypothetical protein